VFGDRHVIVMVSVTGETPYLSGLLASVTVMTLMTVIYGLILKRGASPLPRPLPLQPNPTNPTLGAENPIPMLFSSLQSVSGFLRLADNPTPLPDDGLPLSSGC
jgi:hypothetical protein